MLFNLQARHVCYKSKFSILSRVIVQHHMLLFQTMVVVPEHFLHTLHTLLYRVKTLLTMLLSCYNLIM